VVLWYVLGQIAATAINKMLARRIRVLQVRLEGRQGMGGWKVWRVGRLGRRGRLCEGSCVLGGAGHGGVEGMEDREVGSEGQVVRESCVLAKCWKVAS
jgi:hypothetical protein